MQLASVLSLIFQLTSTISPPFWWSGLVDSKLVIKWKKHTWKTNSHQFQVETFVCQKHYLLCYFFRGVHEVNFCMPNTLLTVLFFFMVCAKSTSVSKKHYLCFSLYVQSRTLFQCKISSTKILFLIHNTIMCGSALHCQAAMCPHLLFPCPKLRICPDAPPPFS